MKGLSGGIGVLMFDEWKNWLMNQPGIKALLGVESKSENHDEEPVVKIEGF